MASEDFSFMLERCPGAYIQIGNGDGAGGCEVHNPGYDFNDAALPLGASLFARLVETTARAPARVSGYCFMLCSSCALSSSALWSADLSPWLMRAMCLAFLALGMAWSCIWVLPALAAGGAAMVCAQAGPRRSCRRLRWR